MTPLLFLDLETTGLSADRHAPISIAVVVLSGPSHGTVFHKHMRPFIGSAIEPKALEVNGYGFGEIMAFQDPHEVFHEFQAFIDKLDAAHVNPGDEGLPLHRCAGWNFPFDNKFLRAWCDRHQGGTYYGNVFDPDPLDVMQSFKRAYPCHKERQGGARLVNAYEHIFKKPLAGAHNEMADTLATRDVFLHLDLQGERRYPDYHNLIWSDNAP